MAPGSEWAALLLGGTGALCWVLLFGLRTFCSLRVPRLADQPAMEPARWPTLSVVVPARDEAATIGPALRTLLSQDYPGLHVIAVDDRSSDGTGQILDAMAREQGSLEVLHLQELPPGWLGKVHALCRGLDRARGELVLFCDADVRFAPGALRRLLAVAEAHGLDHLTALPRLRTTGPLQGALMAAFADGYVERARGRRPVLLGREPALGFGAFNLVRREALERTEGLDWLRMDVLDDLALGELMRRAGARRGFLLADEAMEVEWYPSARAALRSFEKNTFGGLASYRLGRALGGALGGLALLSAPPLLLLQGLLPAWPLLLSAALSLLGCAAAGTLRHRRRLLHGLLTPLILFAMLVRLAVSAVAATRRGGIEWRGTRYPLDELRRGQRVSFP